MIIQGSPEWFSARLGKATASKISDILSTLKTGEAAGRKNYRMDLVCERLTGIKAEGFTNHHMQRGTALEPTARALYEFKTNALVEEVGFVIHPDMEMSGASPDGLVGDDGLIEIKCPTAGNHVDTILSKESPRKYYAQMQWQMACTNRLWCDFVSYCPAVGENLSLFIVRVNRDDKWIVDTEMAVSKFLTEVSELTQQLKDFKNE
jgi:putative phage-type endonuclease